MNRLSELLEHTKLCQVENCITSFLIHVLNAKFGKIITRTPYAFQVILKFCIYSRYASLVHCDSPRNGYVSQNIILLLSLKAYGYL